MMRSMSPSILVQDLLSKEEGCYAMLLLNKDIICIVIIGFDC